MSSQVLGRRHRGLDGILAVFILVGIFVGDVHPRYFYDPGKKSPESIVGKILHHQLYAQLAR